MVKDHEVVKEIMKQESLKGRLYFYEKCVAEDIKNKSERISSRHQRGALSF